MTLTLPLPPNVANARWHWTQRVRAKKRFYRLADERQAFGLVPPPPKAPWARTRLSGTFYVHNLLDPDNKAARLKFVLDWLVTRGYIADDSAAHIELGGFGQQIDRKNKRIEITLEELSDG